MEKTIGLLLIIGLGLFLQKKVKSSDHLRGIKTIILSVALPATIFAALLKVKLDVEMLMLPLFGLLINIVLITAFYLIFKYLVDVQSDKKRSFLMLMPSLAPGLSCFPFIMEYLGSESLAHAALADLGNKIFVLILLYMLAMRWYYQRNVEKKVSNDNRVKELLISLIKEPINLVIIAAILLLSMGINIDSLPPVISSLVLRLSAIMGPLVLLFIGMAVKIKKNDVWFILRMLSLRAGIAFLLCACLLFVLPGLTTVMSLLLLVFAQSSVSFWPFAHIATVTEMEKDNRDKTFNSDIALSVLAISLPFSTITILGILSVPAIAISALYPAVAGILLIMVSTIPPLIVWFRNFRGIKGQELEISPNASAVEK
ncbi:MAG: permease [Bacteroidota bacterium]